MTFQRFRVRGLNFWHIAYCQFNEIRHMAIIKQGSSNRVVGEKRLIYLHIACYVIMMKKKKMKSMSFLLILPLNMHGQLLTN